MAARWHKLKDLQSLNARQSHFILENIQTELEPGPGTFIGDLYKVLQDADTGHEPGQPKATPANVVEDLTGNGPLNGRPHMELCGLLEAYLQNQQDMVKAMGQSLLEVKHIGLHLNPFHYIMRYMSTSPP